MKISFLACAASALMAVLAARPGLARADMQLDAEFFASLAARAGAPQAFTDGQGKLPLMVRLPLGGDARSLGMRAVAPGLATVRVAPRDLLAFEAAHRGMSYSVWPALHPLLDQSARLNGTVTYRAALAAAGMADVGFGKGVVVGVVDTGLDVRHRDFRDATGKTRVAWLLDFAHPSLGRHPELEARYGCNDPNQSACAVQSAEDIDLALSGSPAVYRASDVAGHGTHVASIAAGNGGQDGRFVGGAPQSTLVIAAVGGGAAGSLVDADILAGVQFIFDRADDLKLPAVVNISLGSDFGPHDGTTSLEQGLAAMVGSAHPGRAIIVAAGNSGARYQGDAPDQALGVHTQTRVTRGVPARATVLWPGHQGGGSDQGAGYIWITYGAHDDIRVGMAGPRGLALSPVAMGAKASASSSDDALTAAVFNGVVGGEVPLTNDTHGAIAVWQGTAAGGSAFTLSFEGEGFVDVWVQSSPDGALFDMATAEGTVSVPATHPDLIAVGCTVNRTTWTDATGHAYDVSAAPGLDLLQPVDTPCYFSSAGPTATGLAKPDLSAPGAMVAAAMSQDAAPGAGASDAFDAPAGLCAGDAPCLVIDESHALLSGSSMSAPQVTGATALLLERDPSLTQGEILSLLQQGARRPRARVDADFQLGVGALDVTGAMTALQARGSPQQNDPDARASWLTLSNSYLRSGPELPLQGTVEVRTSDSHIADGFDASRLSLEVGEGGLIQKALQRKAPGVWQFALSSAEGSGHSSVPLTVRIDGTVIGGADASLSGARQLPVGPDAWLAFGSVRAYGGCTWSGASTSKSALRSAWLLALIAVAWRRRCSRHAARPSR